MPCKLAWTLFPSLCLRLDAKLTLRNPVYGRRRLATWVPLASEGVAEIPFVMKQFLLLFKRLIKPGYDVNTSNAMWKGVAIRTELGQHLLTLRAAGLSLQEAACQFRTATSGDMVFLQESHLLSQSQVEALDTDALRVPNRILDITDAETVALGAFALRWFPPL